MTNRQCLASTVLNKVLKFFFFNFKGRVTERARQSGENLPSDDSFANCPQQLEVGQSEARKLGLPGFPHEWHGPKQQGHHLLLSQAHYHKVKLRKVIKLVWDPKQWLHLLHHNAFTSIMFSDISCPSESILCLPDSVKSIWKVTIQIRWCISPYRVRAK